MSTQSQTYLEAILFILDGLDPASMVQLKDDVRSKLQRQYELQPIQLQALQALEKLMKTSEYARWIGG